MKKTPLCVLWIGLTLLVAGCAEPPGEQLSATQQAVDKAKDEEAETYASAEYQQAADALDAARAEIAAQDEASFFSRDYSRAEELLKQAERSAEDAWVAAQNNRGQGRVEAEAALAAAEASMAEARQSFEASRYSEANTRLKAVISKAESISSEVEKARSKAGRGRG